MNNYPFHYEVRLNLFATDDENSNVIGEVQSAVHKFADKSPLENRADAFKEFENYLNFLKENNRIEINRLGNFQIIEPNITAKKRENVRKLYDADTDNWALEDILNRMKIAEDYHQFEEYISVYLVIDDTELAKQLNQIDGYDNYDDDYDTDFEIHKVSSSDFEEQDVVDNLEFVEFKLYKHLEIDTENLVEIVYHYGYAYAESGEVEEDGAKRTILKTPHRWTTLEMYEEIQKKSDNEPNTDITEKIKEIIRKGETSQIEFKPSLLYNFKTRKAGIGIKNIIAKAICAMLNTNSGYIFIGVNDDGSIQGLDSDYSLFPETKNKKDKIRLEVANLITHFFDLSIKPFVKEGIYCIDDKEILIIQVNQSTKPIFLKNKMNDEIKKEFYVRNSASTRQITDIEEIINHTFNTWVKPKE